MGAGVAMNISDAMRIHVNASAFFSLIEDGLEIQIFRHSPGIGNTDPSGNARHALPNACLTRAAFGPAT
jgi:hypothetical protein